MFNSLGPICIKNDATSCFSTITSKNIFFRKSIVSIGFKNNNFHYQEVSSAYGYEKKIKKVKNARIFHKKILLVYLRLTQSLQ